MKLKLNPNLNLNPIINLSLTLKPKPMKTKRKPIIRLLVFILPSLIQLSSFAQGVIKAETGAYIRSETGSYWVVDNGAFVFRPKPLALERVSRQ